MKKLLFLLFFIFCFCHVTFGQFQLSGKITDVEGVELSFANVAIEGSSIGSYSDENGKFVLQNIKEGSHTIVVSYLGYETIKKSHQFRTNRQVNLNFKLEPLSNALDEIVVTGTLKEVNRLESPVPVEVYNPVFFKKNPTPNIYEALQNVNGVRPQLNCQVCNTGDIHINGLEGPYTMVLIDGMPIVSSLATVYGLSGIPNSLIERMEIVKGPASSLYGSEAIGGLINIITKKPTKAPQINADVMSTNWGEFNVDFGLKTKLNRTTSILTGVNYFNYDNIVDNNKDNFTDMTIQKRLSIFQKWHFKRKDNKLFTLAGRYYWEDRWGGELDWTNEFRGSDQIYGEAITTKRLEVIGQYQLPINEDMLFSFSYNSHDQNSVYGDTPYLAQQKIGFGQLTWNKSYVDHDLLFGTALRYTYYDDNTPATGGEAHSISNDPDEIVLPGIFVQDQINLSSNQKLLLGMRCDYNKAHGNIFTPRLAYKLSISKRDIFRINMGTGFRVVNLFTEEHAALTGAREVVVVEDLKPERSFNVNVNYTKKAYFDNGSSGSLELSSWYTYFSNVIFPDYETNSNEIIYKNLEGNAVTKGISLNADLTLSNGLSFLVGGSLMDVSKFEGGISKRQILTERFSGTWAISYKFPNRNITFDYTGNLYGPMLLPTLGELDPRPDESPWWSIQNVQLTYKGISNVEFYCGIKNILDWTPWKNQEEPIIARAFDPFDKDVEFDSNGNALSTAQNPNALTFDPSYVYAPNQGLRVFLGMRYSLN